MQYIFFEKLTKVPSYPTYMGQKLVLHFWHKNRWKDVAYWLNIEWHENISDKIMNDEFSVIICGFNATDFFEYTIFFHLIQINKWLNRKHYKTFRCLTRQGIWIAADITELDRHQWISLYSPKYSQHNVQWKSERSR